ncbi:MAG: hypothetical protein ACK4GK_10045 [Ferrovibrio sp.]
MRGFLILLVLLFAGQAMAQPRWESFAAEKSSLQLHAPDLPMLPSRAQELRGGNPGVRAFEYIWGKPLASAPFADVLVFQQAKLDYYYTREPDYLVQIPAALTYLKARDPQFGAEEFSVVAPLGLLKYRTLSLGSRHCLGFGGLFGVVQGAVSFTGGSVPKGNHWIYGVYCPEAGQRLTPEGARYIMEGFGWSDIGLAKPDRAAPAAIAVAQ